MSQNTPNIVASSEQNIHGDVVVLFKNELTRQYEVHLYSKNQPIPTISKDELSCYNKARQVLNTLVERY